MSEHLLSRTSLSSVGLRTPDATGAARFYERVVGMVAEPGVSPEGAVRLGWGSGHHALELLPGDEPGLDHVGLEVGDAGGPAAVAQRLRAWGVVVDDLGPDAFEVRDPDGNAVRLHGPVARTGEHTADTGRRPIRVQHATLATADMEPMVDFYVGLGFRITDRMAGGFTWLRSTIEHHSIAIVDVGRGGGLDHYSYDLGTWDDFKTWADRLTDLGVPVRWGPGRHGPGNNLFLFFDDPDGNHVELSAEMERFFDDRAVYEPRIWDAAPTTVNLWGGQVPSWRTVEEAR
jgi:catechol 2,3-dioxygenase